SVADDSCRGTYRSRDERLSARKKAHSALGIVRRMFSFADAKSRTSPTDSAFAGGIWKTNVHTVLLTRNRAIVFQREPEPRAPFFVNLTKSLKFASSQHRAWRSLRTKLDALLRH